MAISKIILNGVTQMDVTQDTVASGNLIAPNTAHGADGEPVLGTATAGASNLVTGTFKGTTTGAAMDVTIPYTGNGYPIVVSIEPTGGVYGNTTFNTAIQRYATSVFMACRGDLNTSPTYSETSDINSAQVFVGYKSSTTSATQYSTQGGSKIYLYRDQSASSTATSNVKIKNKTTMSVFIASNSYGFMANVEYTYRIIYSS